MLVKRTVASQGRTWNVFSVMAGLGVALCLALIVQPKASAHVAETRQLLPGGLIFSPYKNVNLHIDKKTGVMRTAVTGQLMPLVGKGSLMATRASNLHAITLAFANGQCGSEHWGDIPGQRFADANIPALDAAGMNYIISTGGEGHMFTCSSHAGMIDFISRYMSPHMLGVDFDIEYKQTQAQIDSLVAQVAYAQDLYPNLRFSFTIATWAASDGSHTGVNPLGAMVIDAVKNAHIINYTIDLMVMDYGKASPKVCVMSDGHCDMGQSAIQAVKNLQHDFHIPPGHIALTPMIGANDTPGEVFTIHDADVLANYAVGHGLAGVHFWSLDRDAPCRDDHAAPTCDSMSSGTPLEYTHRFLSILER